jgi:hypothetical protein
VSRRKRLRVGLVRERHTRSSRRQGHGKKRLLSYLLCFGPCISGSVLSIMSGILLLALVHIWSTLLLRISVIR